MASIKIEDLKPVEMLTDEMLEGIHGGLTSFKPPFGTVAYDAWDPGARTTLNRSVINPSLSKVMFDRWYP